MAKQHQIWKDLSEEQISEAKRLANHARKGNLVLFLGSGISSGAGLPVWSDLLEKLAIKAGMSDEERASLTEMDFLDRARIIEMRLGGSERLGKEVAKAVVVHNYSLACGLLSALPVHEVVTTNYNQMFEIASRAIGLDIAILPYAPASNCDRWLLKMHGCVTHPEDIVLTREDYMRYATRRSALSGIVQSLLITRHMLFAGFSLKDDNFHRIVDEVRRSIRRTQAPPLPQLSSSSPSVESPTKPSQRPRLASDDGDGESIKSLSHFSTPEEGDAELDTKFGTSLTLRRNNVADLLWKQDLNLVAMRADGDHARAARHLEIFLDYLLSLATTATAFLLNPWYDALLMDSQKMLRSSMMDFLQHLSPLAKEAPEFVMVKQFLRSLGATFDEEQKDLPDEKGIASSSSVASLGTPSASPPPHALSPTPHTPSTSTPSLLGEALSPREPSPGPVNGSDSFVIKVSANRSVFK